MSESEMLEWRLVFECRSPKCSGRAHRPGAETVSDYAQSLMEGFMVHASPAQVPLTQSLVSTSAFAAFDARFMVLVERLREVMEKGHTTIRLRVARARSQAQWVDSVFSIPEGKTVRPCIATLQHSNTNRHSHRPPSGRALPHSDKSCSDATQ